MSTRALHTEKLYNLLSDGEWHDLEEVVRAVAVVVPPEKGYRRMVGVWETRRVRRGQDTEGGPQKGDMHRSGQRRIARETIRAQVKAGRLVIEGDKICCPQPESRERDPPAQAIIAIWHSGVVYRDVTLARLGEIAGVDSERLAEAERVWRGPKRRDAGTKGIRSRHTGEVAPEGFKYCPRCKETKPVTSFSLRRRDTGVLNGWCKDCIKADQQERLLKPAELEKLRKGRRVRRRRIS